MKNEQTTKTTWHGTHSKNYRQDQWKDANGVWHPKTPKKQSVEQSSVPKEVEGMTLAGWQHKDMCDSVTGTVRNFLETYNKLHGKNVMLKKLMTDCESADEKALLQKLSNNLFVEIKIAHANLISELVKTFILK